MTRSITTAAELDALPVGSAVRTARGAVATRHECARGWLIAGYFGPQTLYSDTDLPAVVLYDPSAPVRVVSDAVVPSATREDVEAAIFEADDEYALEVHEVRSLASRLHARFTITPRTDR